MPDKCCQTDVEMTLRHTFNMEVKPTRNYENGQTTRESSENACIVKGYNSKGMKIILLSILVIILLIGLGFQVKTSVAKFFAGKTTWASEVVTAADGLLLPTISFCPGYKRVAKPGEAGSARFYEQLTLPTYFDDPGAKQENVTVEDIEQWWHESRYRAHRVFAYIKIPSAGGNFLGGGGGPDPDVLTADDFNQTLTVRELTVTQVDSTYGVCYSLTYARRIPPHTSLIVQLNLHEGPPRVAAFVHAAGDEVGLFHNYWPRAVAHVDLAPDAAVDLAIEKQVRRTRNTEASPCHEGGEGPTYSQCIVQWMRAKYLEANCSEICWVPQSRYITNELALPPCLTNATSRCMLDHLYFGAVVHLDDPAITGCLYPCEEQIYNVFPRRDAQVIPVGAGVSMVALFYRSNVYSLMEEYLLYDANAIVAALGGSLGLFLGFSFLQVGQVAIERVVDRVRSGRAVGPEQYRSRQQIISENSS